MIIKEFCCDKNEGTYIINFSKKECKREDLKIECTYKKADNNRFNVTVFIGIESYDLMYEYLADTIDSNYKNLKDKIKIYILSEINNSTMDKLNEFINTKVVPMPDYLYECVGKIYEISSLSGKKYCASVYSNRTEIKEISIGKITILDGEYKIDKIMSIIKEKELVENERKAS
ncbi:MAG: hypothetical protein K1W35_12990 [Lachnospiraceae bacterium]